MVITQTSHIPDWSSPDDPASTINDSMTDPLTKPLNRPYA